MLDPRDRIAVVFMASAMANAGKYARGIHGLVAEAIRGAASDDEESDEREEAEEDDEAPSGPDLQEYLGTYDSQAWGGETAVIRWRGGLALMSIPTDDPSGSLRRLRHDEGDTFHRIRSDGDPGEAVVFERDDEGQVSGMRIHGQLSRRVR